MNAAASEVIDKLGGTAEVARIFDLRMPSVSDWRVVGIPHGRMMFLRTAHAPALEGFDLDAATAKRRAVQAATRELRHE